jgi:hypothetical protein
MVMERRGILPLGDEAQPVPSRLPKVPSRTTAWIATGLVGLPDLPAKVLGDIAARTTKPVPIDGIVAGIRAFIEVGAPKKPSVTAPGN